MNRDEILLAALVAGGEGAVYSPVQVQKLMFLVDREAAGLVMGPHFDFKPYDYGPFDRQVYDSLEVLSGQGLTLMQNSGKYRMYSVTPDGFRLGEDLLNRLPDKARDFVTQASSWVRSVSFGQLVSSIYKAYPEAVSANRVGARA
jgi:uncharacterized protein YwgA